MLGDLLLLFFKLGLDKGVSVSLLVQQCPLVLDVLLDLQELLIQVV